MVAPMSESVPTATPDRTIPDVPDAAPEVAKAPPAPEASQPAPLTPESVSAIRAEIDRVDDSMLALISERLSLADRLVGPKSAQGLSTPIRPAREVQLLRRLSARAVAPLDTELVVEIWRSLISANVRRQGRIEIIVAGGNDPVRMFDIARRHFGGAAKIQRAPDPQTALMRAVEQPNVVTILPWPAAPGVGSWWPALSESRFAKVQLIAGLPLRPGQNEDPEASLFAAASPEPAGDDISFLIAYDPHHRAQKALADLGFRNGREAARSVPRVLLRVEEFVAADDSRLLAMPRYGLDGVRVLGSYARI